MACRRAELPAYGQAHYVAVEPVTAVQTVPAIPLPPPAGTPVVGDQGKKDLVDRGAPPHEVDEMAPLETAKKSAVGSPAY